MLLFYHILLFFSIKKQAADFAFVSSLNPFIVKGVVFAYLMLICTILEIVGNAPVFGTRNTRSLLQGINKGIGDNQ